MFCVQCGFKIADGYKFCPNCGAKVVSVQDDTQQKHEIPRGELDKIADDIFWEQPVSRGKAKKLSQVTGISIQMASDMIKKRYKEYKDLKKRKLLPDTKYCPCCGSQDIEAYEEPGITVTQPVKAFGGGFISSSSPSSKWMRCNMCGHRWKPKKKR